MQFSTVFAVLSGLLISSASAQTACDSVVSAIPTCGVPCISTAIFQVGCTATTDYSCLCSSQSAVQSAAESCVLSACGFLQGIAVASSAEAVCSCVATASPNATPTPTATAAPTGVVAITTTA